MKTTTELQVILARDYGVAVSSSTIRKYIDRLGIGERIGIYRCVEQGNVQRLADALVADGFAMEAAAAK